MGFVFPVVSQANVYANIEIAYGKNVGKGKVWFGTESDCWCHAEDGKENRDQKCGILHRVFEPLLDCFPIVIGDYLGLLAVYGKDRLINF